MKMVLVAMMAAGLLGAGATKTPARPATRAAPAKAPPAPSKPPPPAPPDDAPVATVPEAGNPVELPRPSSSTAAMMAGHSGTGDTRCAACHVTASWTQVRFDHDRTGFPLTGVHQSTSCKNCHGGDFQTPVPRTCVGCHKDAHAGDLGGRCEGCHDTASWASAFNADSHRRTAFPLIGAHAALPCQECHFQLRDTRFPRAAVDCRSCHQADLQRTRFTSLDHDALGFTGACQTCHGAWRFSPANFPGHDQCFVISSGAHAGIACLSCHSSLSSNSGMPGTCSTRSTTCSSCHDHLCSGKGGTTPTDLKHANVLGYKCAGPSCAQCHPSVLRP